MPKYNSGFIDYDFGRRNLADILGYGGQLLTPKSPVSRETVLELFAS
jgi:hypothetical protein